MASITDYARMTEQEYRDLIARVGNCRCVVIPIDEELKQELQRFGKAIKESMHTPESMLEQERQYLKIRV